jgi:preprotein translocase subunit SecY
MSEGGGPSAGTILVAIFMLLAGLCITLLGGGCTLMWLAELNSPYGGMGGILNPLFLLSLATFAGGLGMLWVGFKLLTGKYRN